ncbi:unnamed protein product [Phytophthora lilii]|uniref:Unnamed protein product n=1 Tax=Phytophthora lilii TaxID=2077276 RepID=A0A9W6TBH7_9STRA|nr:unnamed protein product [Phytophthora lilii]
MKSTPTKAGGQAAYQMAFTSNYEVVEAAYMFSYNGYYYLFFSKGSCCGYDKTRPAKGKEYRILVCRSKHATSGFVDKNGKTARTTEALLFWNLMVTCTDREARASTMTQSTVLSCTITTVNRSHRNA